LNFAFLQVPVHTIFAAASRALSEAVAALKAASSSTTAPSSGKQSQALDVADTSPAAFDAWVEAKRYALDK
jgi:hypothetical protein